MVTSLCNRKSAGQIPAVLCSLRSLPEHAGFFSSLSSSGSGSDVKVYLQLTAEGKNLLHSSSFSRVHVPASHATLMTPRSIHQSLNFCSSQILWKSFINPSFSALIYLHEKDLVGEWFLLLSYLFKLAVFHFTDMICCCRMFL